MQTLSQHRPWKPPDRRPFLRMQWHNLLFMHWPIPAKEIQRLLPPGLIVDTFDGDAWLGIVPFTMSDIAPIWCPAVPGLSNFPELNIRTYVRLDRRDDMDTKPGVWFFSLDATQWLAVRIARNLFHLNYIDAAIECQQEQDGWLRYSSRRKPKWPPADLSVRYRSAGKKIAQTTSLDRWLTSRYCMYADDSRANLYRGEIDHEPWSLEEAECEIELNQMTQWLGLELPDQPPLLHFSKSICVKAWSMDRVIV